MINQIINNNISFISNVRFLLRGYWSGYDDNLYLVSTDHPDEELDAKKTEHTAAFLAGLCAFDFSEWTKYRVPCFVDPWQSPCWVLEISFSNGLPPLCFSGVESFPKNFQYFLPLVGAGEEDDCYFDDYDEDVEIGDDANV